ncbi:MAG: ketoacyl-ACP synthase III [Acidobacteria bacterium]|nr:MAG: ketoacyl-ACP synthase III [Acidobacteriota bacterium]
MGARILGIGSAVPPRRLTNDDLEKIVDTSDEWIVTRTGISERRIAPEGTCTSDLVGEASRAALERAGIGAEQVDALIVATATPDTPFPSTACWAQPKIGLRRVPVFDISAACSGFLYGYALADSLIASGRCRYVLVVGAELLSRFMNWEDRTTCVLFGDGAGAAVFGPGAEEGDGLIAHTWGADGALAELLWEPAGGSRHPATHETVDKKMHTVHMAGNEVFKHAVKAMQRAVGEVMERAGVGPDDIDLFVPHQANIRIMKATADRARIPTEKVYVTIHKYGNVSAASIPMAINDALEEERLARGDLVLSAAFGAGFTWAAALFRL